MHNAIIKYQGPACFGRWQDQKQADAAGLAIDQQGSVHQPLNKARSLCQIFCWICGQMQIIGDGLFCGLYDPSTGLCARQIIPLVGDDLGFRIIDKSTMAPGGNISGDRVMQADLMG